MDTPDLTAAAHAYAKRGWRVIPLHRVGPDMLTCSCRNGRKCGRNAGKHPIDAEWQKKDRLSGADIETTWGGTFKPNIGIATGSDSGFWVLDIDPEGGGFDSIRQLLAEHGDERLPDTWVAQTGSGGYHYAFEMPDFNLRNSQGRIAPGIDVRANGGQVVAPPSRSGKGTYAIVQDLPVAKAPAWLLELARKDEVEVETVTAVDLPKPEDLDEHTWKRYSAYAQRAIDDELGRLDKMRERATSDMREYRGEPWNATTFEVCCALIEFANSPWCAYNQALADVLAHAPRDAEFDDYTVRKTYESAREKVGPKARLQPEDRRQEPDPMFSNPEVIGGSPDPSEGGEAQPGRTALMLFGGEKGTTPLYPNIAAAVIGRGGPIGWGVDNDFWKYEDGVWVHDGYVAKHRLIEVLGFAYKSSHYPSTYDIVQKNSQRLTADPDHRLMNFRNGMVDWATGDIYDHEPSYGSTIQFGCEWDPEATCPSFDAWLESTLHPDYVELAWEVIGYLMMSGNPLHHAILLYGIGGSGKSTLLQIITNILGRQNIASETLDDLNSNNFRSANLFGKIANIAGDIDPKYQETTAVFKRITGQDTISAERKHKDPFSFVNWAVPVFSANRIPGSADVTEGYLRRWIILKFTKAVPPKDRIENLAVRLSAELPGIAYKAVLALRELMTRGATGAFDPQGEALAGFEEFALTIDQVRRWHASGEVMAGPEVETPLREVYAHYCLWADRVHQSKLGEQEFTHRLESLGHHIHDLAGEKFVVGLSVPKQGTPHHQTVGGFFGGQRQDDED